MSNVEDSAETNIVAITSALVKKLEVSKKL